MSDNEILVKLVADMKGFQADMAKSVATANESARQMAAGFNSGISSITGAIGTIGATMGMVAAGAGFKKLIDETVSWNLEAQKMAKTMGGTTESASVMNVALHTLGIDQDVAASAALRLSKDLTTGTEKFDKYGIAVKDSNGNLLPMPQIMANVNQALLETQTGTSRNIMAMDLYGRSWKEISSILKLTPREMEEAQRTAERLHLVVGPEGIEKSREYKRNLNEISLVAKSLSIQMGNELLPAIVSVGSALANQGTAGASMFARALASSVRAVQEAAVYWGSAYDKKKAWIDTGGMLGHIFSKDQDSKYKQQIKNISEAESQQLAEIDRMYTTRVVTSAPAFTPPGKDKILTPRSGRSSAAFKGLTDQQKAYQEQIKTFLRDSWDNAANELAAEDFTKDATRKMGLFTGKIDLPKSQAISLGIGPLKSLEQQQAETDAKAQIEENTRKAELLNNEIQRGSLEAAKAVAELNGEWSRSRELEDRILQLEIKRAQLTNKPHDIPLLELRRDQLQNIGFNSGFTDVVKSWGDTSKQMEEMGRATAQTMQSEFSTIFFDGMQGKLHKLSDYFDEFTKSVEKIIADFLAKQLVKEFEDNFLSGVTSIFSYFGGSGGELNFDEILSGSRASGSPELSTPGASGIITTTNRIGGGNTFAPVYQIDARNSTLTAPQIQEIIDRSVRQSKADILNNMNRGGEFAIASGRMTAR